MIIVVCHSLTHSRTLFPLWCLRMEHSRPALELDGTSSSATVDIENCNTDIVRLRKISISLIEQELADLQHTIDHRVEDAMIQLKNEKKILKRDITEERERIKVSTLNSIDLLKHKYQRQCTALNQQKELLTAQHHDQEIEEIVTLLNSNLRSIKNRISVETIAMNDMLEKTEVRYAAEKARIESHAAEYRVAIKEDVYQQVSQLQTRLEHERKVLSIEEACRSCHHPLRLTSSTLTPLLPSLMEDNAEDGSDAGEENVVPGSTNSSPIVGNRLEFSTRKSKAKNIIEEDESIHIDNRNNKLDKRLPLEGGYSESDSDSDLESSTAI